jgi:hypothetical protein
VRFAYQPGYNLGWRSGGRLWSYESENKDAACDGLTLDSDVESGKQLLELEPQHRLLLQVCKQLCRKGMCIDSAVCVIDGNGLRMTHVEAGALAGVAGFFSKFDSAPAGVGQGRRSWSISARTFEQIIQLVVEVLVALRHLSVCWVRILSLSVSFFPLILLNSRWSSLSSQTSISGRGCLLLCIVLLISHGQGLVCPSSLLLFLAGKRWLIVVVDEMSVGPVFV